MVGAINRVCDPTDLALTAAGGLPGELCKNWRAKSVGTFDCEFGFSCMGYEIAGGWGAKMADPERDVIVFVGDGSYLMMNSDIYSSVLTGHKLIVVVCDNGGFAVINRLQNAKGSASFNNLIEDCRIEREVAVDFAKHAESMGAHRRERVLDRRARGGLRARQGGRPHLRHRDRRRGAPVDAGRCLVGRRRARGQPARGGAQRRAPTTSRAGRSSGSESEHGRGARAAGPIRLGIAPIGWSNDDLPELGGDIPLEHCLREARAAGYAGVEKGGKFPMDAEGAGPDPRGARPEAGHRLVLGRAAPRHASSARSGGSRRSSQLYQALGAPVMVYAETTGTVQNQIDVPVAERPRMPDEEFKRYGDKLTELAEWLRGRGLPDDLPPPHGHGRRDRARDRSPDGRHRRGGRPAARHRPSAPSPAATCSATTRRHGQRINHVHCKDIRARRARRASRPSDWSFLKGVLEGVFTVPGDGVIDFGPSPGCWPRSAIAAGSWSRPSRTRPRPTRSRWRRSATRR